MPEAITYYDMQRMIAAQVPAGIYHLEVHQQWFRDDKSRIPTIENGELLEEYALDGKEFTFKGSDVQHYGKALGIPLSNGIWLRVHFLLHGHGLPCCREEYDSKVQAWKEDKEQANHTFILAAIVGVEMCVILVDRNRLTTITPIHTTNSIWYDTTLAPCPIQHPDAFEKNILSSHKSLTRRTGSIYKEMSDSSKNQLWNGIGTSHAVEILHRAFIHPEYRTQDVFSNKKLQQRLLSAIRTFFQIVKFPEYCQRVPAGSTSNRAFDFSPAVSQYINSQFTKAYRKPSTLLSLYDYNMLQRAGLLGPEMKALEDGWEQEMGTDTGRLKSRRVPIYTIELRSKKEWESDPDKDDGNLKKKGRAKYTYTCIYPQFKAKNGTILSEKEAEKKLGFLNGKGNKAEIGIGSFMDTVKEMQLLKEKTIVSSHVISIKTGKRGRPRARKLSHLEVRENNKRAKSA